MIYEKSVADAHFLRGEYETAAKMFHEGARDGSADAAFNYAYCLYHGYGVEQNFAEAKSFFSYARDLEGGEACYNLAMLYMEGRGVPKDYKQAVRYMTDSAAMGCVEAQLYLGMAYTTGYLLYPDIVFINMIPFHKPEYRDESVALLMGDVEDAERDEDERFSVIRADQRMAFEYFRSAARHDPTYVEDLVAKGQYLYAKCYVDGMGTDFDRNKSLRLMLLAGKSGSQDAVDYLVSNGITEQMLLEAVNEGRNKR